MLFVTKSRLSNNKEKKVEKFWKQYTRELYSQQIMKNILITSALLLTTIVGVAQTNFIRAYSMHKGEYINDDIEFDDGSPCNILIEFTGSIVTLHGTSTRTFHLVSIDYESENLNTWNAVDQDGRECIFYFGITENSALYVMFEYGNKTVLYYGNSEK